MKGAFAGQSGRGAVSPGSRSRRRTRRWFRASLLWSRAGASGEASTPAVGPWPAAKPDCKANGKDDRNAPSPNIGWPSDGPDGDCSCFGSFEVCDPSSATAEAGFRRRARKRIEHGRECEAVGCGLRRCAQARARRLRRKRARRRARSSRSSVLPGARDRRCARARPAPARSSAPVRLLCPFPFRHRRGGRPTN